MHVRVSRISVASSKRVLIGIEMVYGVAASKKVSMCPCCSVDWGDRGRTVSLLMNSVACRAEAALSGCGRCTPFLPAHDEKVRAWMYRYI